MPVWPTCMLRVKCRITEYVKNEAGELVAKTEMKNTTVGRAILSLILPKGMEYALIDEPKVLTAAEQADPGRQPAELDQVRLQQGAGQKLISRLLNTCYRKQGLKDTVIFADQLMYTGFHYAALSGASVGIDDMVIPDAKKDIIAAAEARSRRDPGPVPVRSGDRGRTLQQGYRYLGQRERSRLQGHDGQPFQGA